MTQDKRRTTGTPRRAAPAKAASAKAETATKAATKTRPAVAAPPRWEPGRVTDASRLAEDRQVTADVVVIGSGAGGAITAEMLARAGLQVVLVEEGGSPGAKAAGALDADAADAIYAERLGRRTKDGGIALRQGRTLGGGTVANWGANFRAPDATLAHWQTAHGLKGLGAPALGTWYEQVERRLQVERKPATPDANAPFSRATRALGYACGAIAAPGGASGAAHPVDAAPSMRTGVIPAALKAGAQLYTRLRAQAFSLQKDRIQSLTCEALAADGYQPTGRRVTLRAKHYVVAAGALHGPALLMRSNVPDASRLLGRRVFVHPTATSVALFREPAAAAGAYCDRFLEQDPLTGRLGFRLEVPPLDAALLAAAVPAYGDAHADVMRQAAHAQVVTALVRDGFHAKSVGGKVELGTGGQPVLDYPLNDVVWDGVRRALVNMAELQFAAGAQRVWPGHEAAVPTGYTHFAETHGAIRQFRMAPVLVRLGTSHLMGGCAMGADAKQGVVDVDGRHFQVANLSVHDASVFPTGLGTDPQLTVCALAARMSSGLARRLGAKTVVRLA